MSLFVLDASATLAWCFEEERTPEAAAIRDHVVDCGAMVPPIWAIEVGNALLAGTRRGRFTSASRNTVLALLRHLNIKVDQTCDNYVWSQTLVLADNLGLSLHDASYVELASRRRCGLATLDAKMRRAAAKSGVPLLDG